MPNNDGQIIMTSFDIEKILREAGAPKAFAKAVAAASRAAGLFDRCQADLDLEIEALKKTIMSIITNMKEE